jgi:hypothetical protein
MRQNLYDLSIWRSRATKLAVLVPCRETIYTVFSASLNGLVKTCTQVGMDVHVIYDSSTILLNQRENLAKQALSINADYMLWLDSDMVFPHSTALRLMAHNKDVVGANYMKRANPLTTVAYTELGQWDSWLPLHSQEELEVVEGVGMGCMLMKTEDFYFQKKLQEKNIKIHIDMNLSRQIRHIGQWAYGPSISTNSEQITKRMTARVKNDATQ